MINIHDIIADTIVLGGASVIGMFLKIAFKPTEAEARLIARVLIGVSMLVVSFARRWSHEHKGEIDTMLHSMRLLKEKVNRTKIGKGPVG